MKLLKNCVALILVIVLSTGICACSSQTGEIKSLTKRFENSCNELDLNEMLDCIDPDVAQSIKTLTGFIGMFSDKDTDELLESFAKVLFSELPENSKEFFSSIKISLDNVEVEEENGVASAEITYEISGEEKRANASFEYVCVDGKWYISNLDIE